jgi:hypothetical protein
LDGHKGPQEQEVVVADANKQANRSLWTANGPLQTINKRPAKQIQERLHRTQFIYLQENPNKKNPMVPSELEP